MNTKQARTIAKKFTPLIFEVLLAEAPAHADLQEMLSARQRTRIARLVEQAVLISASTEREILKGSLRKISQWQNRPRRKRATHG